MRSFRRAHHRRARVHLRASLAVGLLLAAFAPAAHAATLETIETPSAFVDPAKVRFNGADHPKRLLANVLLPDGYADGDRRYPVLFLLHGAGDSYSSWARPDVGDVAAVARGLDAIIVMPEGDTGFYTNWWNGGRRGDPGWERFYIEELIPLVERRYRIRPERRWHAIAGLSMGGFGATYLATQLPGYFGSAATFSGFVQHQRPEVPAGLPAAAGVSYEDIFGPMDGFYATGHNPTRLVDNLRATRLYVTVGSGLAEPGIESSPAAVTAGGAIEVELRLQAEELVSAARSAGVAVTYVPENGVHDWPYWRRHLNEAILWNLFAPVPEQPAQWSYRTVAQRGEAWGLHYELTAPPGALVTLSRDRDVLRGAVAAVDNAATAPRAATHAATAPPAAAAPTVTVTNAAGCGFTTSLPFTRPLPPDLCGRLRVRVARTRLLVGRATRVRVRVSRVVDGRSFAVAGARVTFGRSAARTDAGGRAVLRVRAHAPGVHHIRARVAGLPAARVAVRVTGS